MNYRNYNIDLMFYKNADIDRLHKIVLELCNENDETMKEINYLTERYKPESCKKEVAELRKKLFSTTSLMVLLSDLRDQISVCSMEQQAMNLFGTNSNYGENPQSPEKER